MTETILHMKPIPVLLITKSDELKKEVTLGLIDHFGEQLELHRLDTLQDAIERLEQKKISPEVIIVEQKNSSTSLLKLMFDLVGDAATILICSEASVLNDLKSFQDKARLIASEAIDSELPIALKKLEAIGKIKNLEDSEEYVAIPAERILAMHPLPIDVYLKLSSGKCVKVFRKSDQVVESDVKKYTGQTFFLRKNECDQMFKEQVSKLEAIAAQEPVDEVQAKKVANMSQDLVRSLVEQVGFTEEAQRIAKASVNLSLKLIGTKPRLSMILQDLRKKEGNFVTSHSFLLGQIACAMAYTVGWNSAPTFFKLSMAAFLHDISLNINTHEQEISYEEAVNSGNYHPEELKILRFHATRAADYTRQFSEIPADVEQIVAQHHERPDGSGYPRGLTAKYISPMSALFIIAHDLILFMMRHPDAKMEKFYEFGEKEYPLNPFRKIITALKTESKMT
jgi:hypothetical protein